MSSSNPDAPTPDSGIGGVSRRTLLAGSAVPLLGLSGCSNDSTSPGPAATTPGSGSRTPSATHGGIPASPSPTSPSTAAAGDVVPSVLRVSGPDITHGTTARHEVALTFHGQGTMAITRAVLDACAAAHAHITVFAVGQWVKADPAQARAVIAAGHELGNHTWSHQQMKQLGAAVAATEVSKGRAAVAALGPGHTRLFRPSGTQSSTATIRAAAAKAGYLRCISYSVDPADYTDPGASAVRRRTRQAARPGSIVSLHLGHAGTAEALPGILADLSHAGLAPVTVSALLRD